MLQVQVARRVHIAARPKPHRKPPNRRARAAAAAIRAAAAAARSAKQPRSRPGELILAELQARAGSQWALLDQEAARREAADAAWRKEVVHMYLSSYSTCNWISNLPLPQAASCKSTPAP